MILYNVTAIIDEEIHEMWLEWIETHYIPVVMSRGSFVSSRLLKVLDSPNEGITYCLQFIADSLDNYNYYKDHLAADVQSAHDKKFEGNALTFSTLMEFIDTR